MSFNNPVALQRPPDKSAARLTQPDDLVVVEGLREVGDYATLNSLLPTDWISWTHFDERTIRVRLLVAEIYDRQGDIEGVSRALEPYVNAIRRVPFAVADRLLVGLAVYKHRVGDWADALKLAESAQAFSLARKNAFFLGEAIQIQAEALWSLGKPEQATDGFRQAITSYTEHQRYYRFGLASSRLGEVLYLTGSLEEARIVLRRAVVCSSTRLIAWRSHR